MTQPRNTLSASRPPNRPRILDDYSHMFLDAEAGSMWTNLTASLRRFGDAVEARNLQRRRPYRVFIPSQIETSVAF